MLFVSTTHADIATESLEPPLETLSEETLEDTSSYPSHDPIEVFISNLDDEQLSLEFSNEDLWQRIKSGYAMQNINSQYTAKHEHWYQARPEYVHRMLQRSKKYLFHIVEEVEKRGMPTEIALLPMIESAYNPQAYSRSHASGIWQFVPATGKNYGLKQNYWTDKRRDIMAATDAALTYLQKLYGMFGSWDLALAAYNAGEGTVSRAIERNRKKGLPTDYQHLDLPNETKHYVPKLQAIKNIITEPERYGLALNDIPNKPYFQRVDAPNQMDATLAAKLAEISIEEFNALNPSYNKPIVVSSNETHQILLPVWAVDTFQENLANYDKPLLTWQTYYAKKGERISYIAKKFNISPYKLREINNLDNISRIKRTRPLLVPSQGAHREGNIVLTTFNQHHQKFHEPKHSSTLKYKVKRGDTLSEIANRFNIKIQDIKKRNKLSRNTLRTGQTLYIPNK